MFRRRLPDINRRPLAIIRPRLPTGRHPPIRHRRWPPRLRRRTGFTGASSCAYTFGLGYGSLTGSGSYSGTTTIAGSGVSVGVALGGGVAENLALYGTVFVSSFGDANSGSNTGTDASLGGYAAGVVYYFMPINVYVSGAVGVAGMGKFDSQGKLIDSSNIGLGFDGIVGKEWRVSRHWGLGLAAELVGATGMKDKADPNVTWRGGAFNFLSSATFY